MLIFHRRELQLSELDITAKDTQLLSAQTQTPHPEFLVIDSAMSEVQELLAAGGQKPHYGEKCGVWV